MSFVSDASSSVPRGKGRPRSQAVDAAILRAAAQLAGERPFREITMDAIAAQAGVGRKSIYRRYPHKAAVIDEALHQGYMEMDFAVFPDTGSLTADYLAWTSALRHVLFHQGRVELFHALAAVQLASAESEAPGVGLRWRPESIEQRLVREVRDGTLRQDVDLDALQSALVDPFIVWALCGQDPGAQWCERLAATVLGGLLRGTS